MLGVGAADLGLGLMLAAGALLFLRDLIPWLRERAGRPPGPVHVDAARDTRIRTELGGRVVCEDCELLYEEAPEAYKKIDTVVGDLVAAGLCSVVATLRPVLTYKTRSRR